MVQPIYTKEKLESLSLPGIKKIARSLGVTPDGNKTYKSVWIDAIVAHQSAKVEKLSGGIRQIDSQVELEQYIEAQAEAVAPEQYEVGYQQQDTIEVTELDGVRTVTINGELAGQYWYDDSRQGNSWVMKAGNEEWAFAAPMQAQNTITYNFRTNRTPLVQTEEIATVVEIEAAIAVRTTKEEVEVILGSYEENISDAQAFMGFYQKAGAEAQLTAVRYLRTYDYEMVFRGLPQHTIESFRQTFGRGHTYLNAKKERPKVSVFETDVPNVYAVWSGGERYTVTIHDDDCTCSCPHYHFRHQQPLFVDKHIEAVKNAIRSGDIPPELVAETKHTYRVNAPIKAKFLNLNTYGEWQNELDFGYRYSNSVDAMFQRNPIKVIANRVKVGDRLGHYRVDEICTCAMDGGYSGLRIECLPLDYQEVVVGSDHATMYREMDERRKHRANNLRVIECFDHNMVAL